MKTTINLQDELIKVKNQSKSLEDIDFDKMTADLDFLHVKTQLSEMGFNEKVKQLEIINIRKENGHKFNKESIFNLAEIRKICEQYGLTFLPTKLYKGEIDIKCHQKIEKLKLEYKYNFGSDRFYIAAPASSFILQARPKDPIMFYDLGHNNFLFIYKWGKDISILRKLVFFPFRSIKTYLCILISLSLICGLTIPLFLHLGPFSDFWPLSLLLMVATFFFGGISSITFAEKMDSRKGIIDDGL